MAGDHRQADTGAQQGPQRAGELRIQQHVLDEPVLEQDRAGFVGRADALQLVQRHPRWHRDRVERDLAVKVVAALLVDLVRHDARRSKCPSRQNSRTWLSVSVGAQSNVRASLSCSTLGGMDGGTRCGRGGPFYAAPRVRGYPRRRLAGKLAGGPRAQVTTESAVSDGRWSGRRDSNSRPPEPHSGALPGCATPGWQESVGGDRSGSLTSRSSDHVTACSGRANSRPTPAGTRQSATPRFAEGMIGDGPS